MNEPASPSPLPRWLIGAVLTLLTAQVGLLWMQGSMLERQHGVLQSLRQDMQDLTESLDEFQGNFDQGADETVRPSRHPLHPRRPLQRVRLQQEPQEEKDPIRKELEDSRKSEKEAVEKARDVRSKLSYEENARKADEKAKIEAETHKYRPLIWIGVAVDPCPFPSTSRRTPSASGSWRGPCWRWAPSWGKRIPAPR